MPSDNEGEIKTGRIFYPVNNYSIIMDIMSLWLIPGLLGSSKYGCRISDSVDISSTQDECSLAISRRHMILFRKKLRPTMLEK